MSQRFSLDRQSFEQFLSAATVLQQLEKRCLPITRDKTQSFSELVETQQAIEIGTLDLHSAIERITALALKLTDARGAAVWLFAQAEFIYSGGAGTASNDHRLKMQVLSRLAATSRLTDDTVCEPEDPSITDSEGNYPSAARSLLIAPIYQGRNIAGALAAFSDEPTAFLDQDTTSIRLLSGLVAHALDKKAERELKQSVSAERATMLKVIEQLAPSLEKLALQQEQERQSSSQAYSPELVAEGLVEKRFVEEQLPVKDQLQAEAASTTAETTVDHSAEEHAVAEPAASPAEAIPSVAAGETRVPQWVLDSSKKDQDTAFVSPLEFPSIDSPIRSLSAFGKTAPVSERTALSGQIPVESAVPVEQTASETPTPIVFPEIVGALALQDSMIIAQIEKEAAPQIPDVDSSVVTQPFAPVSQVICAQTASLLEPPQTPEPITSGELQKIVLVAEPKAAEPAEITKAQAPEFTLVAPPVHASSAEGHPSAIPIEFSEEFWNRRQQREHEMMAALTLHASKKLRVAQSSMNHAVGTAKTKGRAVTRYRINLLIRRSASELRDLRRATGASLVLLIMLAFVILEIGMHSSFQTAAASSPGVGKDTSSRPVIQASAHVDAHGAVTSKAVKGASGSALPSSHLRITDPEAAEEVSELSQYEVTRLFQQAAHGDDWSAFQLGMAYETGQGVSQNCQKAAQWVSRSAGMGNLAAEYNLGLRYRDGDGLQTNASEAQKWLSKASKWKYPGAQAALAGVGVTSAQASAPQPVAEP